MLKFRRIVGPVLLALASLGVTACGGGTPVPAQYWDGVWQGTCSGVAYNVKAPTVGRDYSVYAFNLDLPLTSGYATLELYGYSSNFISSLTVTTTSPSITIYTASNGRVSGPGRTFLQQAPYQTFYSAHAAEVVIRNVNFSVIARCPVWGSVSH